MPVRRQHTKSRHGCERCKRRHIKCDEAGPPCGHCISRQVECKYPDILRHSRLSGQIEEAEGPLADQAATHNVNAESLEQLQSSYPPWTVDRTRELQLMHQWSLKTCHSFSPGLSETFQDYVVHQALQFPFLMDSLLALSSLHLATEQPDSNDSTYHRRDALHYQGCAVPAFRAALEIVSPSNCNALFACSVIMMACAAVSPSLQRNDENSSLDRTSTLHDLTLMFPFVKGIHSIIDQARSWLVDGPFQSAILMHPDEEWTLPSRNASLVPAVLRELYEEETSRVSETRVCYGRAIKILDACSQNEELVIPWIVVVGKDFVDRVQSGEPLALLIYICWGALLGRSDTIWWTRVAGRSIVRSLAGYISSENTAWNGVVAWAREVVELF